MKMLEPSVRRLFNELFDERKNELQPVVQEPATTQCRV